MYLFLMKIVEYFVSRLVYLDSRGQSWITYKAFFINIIVFPDNDSRSPEKNIKHLPA